MKKDKVLIKLEVPELNKTYDIYISSNELVWKTNKLILKVISELNDNLVNPNDNYILLNKNSNTIYNSNIFIKDTDIINGSELVLLRG
jgi:hypothetical protein